MDYILFSCIGDMDPISNGFDGPFLHIIRRYMPKKVFLFYTKRFLGVYEEDNDYENEILKVNKECKVEKLKDMIDIHSYDFDTDFQKYCQNMIVKIVAENECKKDKNTLLVNITSGTPQMIAALCIAIISMPKHYNVLPVQVLRPHFVEYPVKKADLSINADDSSDFYNRTVSPDFRNFISEFSKRHLKSMIWAFEYEIALKFARETFYNSSSLEHKKIIAILENLMLRQSMEFNKVKGSDQRLKEVYTIETSYPVSNPDNKEVIIMEYLQIMLLKSEKKDIHGFFMLFSVVFAHLTSYFINNKYGISLVNNAISNEKMIKIEQPTLYQKLIDLNFKYSQNRQAFEFKSSFFKDLLYLYGCDSSYPELFEKFEQLRNIEVQIRNILAHGMPENLSVLFKDCSFKTAKQKIMEYATIIFGLDPKSKWDFLINIKERNRTVIEEIKNL